jgi:hypothetical protein
MAMRRNSSADLVTAKVDKSAWLTATSKRVGGRVKTASEVLSQYDPSRWLLSHVSIMASVDIELADANDPKSDYYIKSDHSQFVNNNGDCWERELLSKTYKTFLGANNYVEHIQQPEFSRGKVVDVALREVDLGLDPFGKPSTTLYVDLLIATSWEFPDMCQKILSGEYNAVSMGCLIAYSRCSRCGNLAHDESEQCEHIMYYRRNTFYDEMGRKRIIAEICGHKDDPKSVTFIDASWVRKPAFVGAVLRNIVSPPESIKANIARAVTEKGTDKLMESVKSRSVFESEHHDVNAFMKAASLKVAEDPDPNAPAQGDARFEDKPKEEAPADQNFAEAPEGGDPAVPEGDPSQDPAGAPEPEGDPAPEATPEEAKATPFADINKSIEDSVLLSIKQNLLGKVQQALKVQTPSEEIGDGINRYTDITRQGESFVKEASSPVTAKYLRDRYSIDVSKVGNPKLASNLMAFASVKDLSFLKKIGFTRSDMVEVLAFVDSRMTGVPVAPEVVSYVAKTAGNAGTSYNLGFVLENIRPLTASEKVTLKRWSTLLEGW